MLVNIDVDMNNVESVENYLKLLRASKPNATEPVKKLTNIEIFNLKRKAEKQKATKKQTPKTCPEILYSHVAKQKGKKAFKVDIFKARKSLGFKFNTKARMNEIVEMAVKKFPDLKRKLVERNGIKHTLLTIR